jgi:hypothetical protein
VVCRPCGDGDRPCWLSLVTAGYRSQATEGAEFLLPGRSEIQADDLMAAGSIAAARAAGKARIEGKAYVMRDGDGVEFRHQGG